MIIQTWSDTLTLAMQNLWSTVIGSLPNLIGALLVIIIGLIIATAFGAVIEKLISLLKIDSVLEKLGFRRFVERGGLSLNSGRFLGQLVFWLIAIAFFLAASDILRLYALSDFFRQIIYYIPNIIAAVLILVMAVLFGEFLRSLIRSSMSAAKIKGAQFVSTAAWYAIVIFAVLAALTQLGIATSIINILITGLVAMLAIAGGLAFGLGGKEYASYLIDKIREEIGGKK